MTIGRVCRFASIAEEVPPRHRAAVLREAQQRVQCEGGLRTAEDVQRHDPELGRERDVLGDALRQQDDYYPYVRGLIAYSGFRSTGIRYEMREHSRAFTIGEIATPSSWSANQRAST